MLHARGDIRDAIVGYLSGLGTDATLSEIDAFVRQRLDEVPPSSVRSYLNLNVPEIFERTGRGRYKLRRNGHESSRLPHFEPIARIGKAQQIFHADCFDWLAQQHPSSIQAVVTDPPYGLLEYSKNEQIKLRKGRGGVWRIPPSFDGHKRSPLPRFTVLDEGDKQVLFAFFRRFAAMLGRVLVPGANVIVASNPLLSHLVACAMVEGGLELRGTVVRLVMTMRGGDRPKNAHREFDAVSVMPRSMWEPWVVLRRPIEGRVQDNLRTWNTGGFRRPSAERPFGDVIRSGPTPKQERTIAPHPSLKPQAFLRQVVRAALPLGTGMILDPFAGSGSTLAAANAVGYSSIGIESDSQYIRIATGAIGKLASLQQVDPV